MMNRRTAVGQMLGAAAAVAAPSVRSAIAAEAMPKTKMGLVIYVSGIRRRWLRVKSKVDLFEPMTFLKHAGELGAGGIQANLGTLSAAAIRDLRDYADAKSLFIEAIVKLPKSKADLSRFQAEIRTAAAVNVPAVRTVIIPGRRYERFKSLTEFRRFEALGRRMLERAAPVAEKHRVPLAVENHKDHRLEERVALLKQISSEFVGACVDTGNSFALLEDPVDTVRALAPWAFSVHLKDQAVQPYPDGFLLGDVPLGEGCLDLKRLVIMLKKAKPKVRFSLELITRDALKVPCLTERYWAPMPRIPARDLARTLRVVKQRSAKTLQKVSALTLDKQVALEEQNVKSSIRYAQKELEL